MISKHGLSPVLHLPSKTHDSGNSAQRKNADLGVRIKNKCAMAVPVH